MGPYLKHQRVVYDHIIIIFVADNTILGVALLLITRFAGYSTMHGGRRKGGAITPGNFSNKDKHNISPIIILLPPIFLTFSTASESLNSSPSTVPNRLNRQYCNTIAPPPPPAAKKSAPHKSDIIAAAILWPLLTKNPVSFILKK